MDSLPLSSFALSPSSKSFLGPSLFCFPLTLYCIPADSERTETAIRLHGYIVQSHQLGVKLTKVVKAQPIWITAGMAGKSISVLKYTICFFQVLGLISLVCQLWGRNENRSRAKCLGYLIKCPATTDDRMLKFHFQGLTMVAFVHSNACHLLPSMLLGYFLPLPNYNVVEEIQLVFNNNSGLAETKHAR